MKKQTIYNYSEDELRDIISDMGYAAFRAEQIIDGLYSKYAASFRDIQTLPKQLRSQLENKFVIDPLHPEEISTSQDGTRKLLFRLGDDSFIESVIILERNDKFTLCLSTQAGCMLDCAFCATGKLPFRRNLQSGEIIAQYLSAQRLTNDQVSNIVYMGMGEPLLNYPNVIKSLKMLIEGKTKMIGKKRITLSTVGVLPQMKDLRKDNPGIKLALSLHATTDKQREEIIPVARKWSIKELQEELLKYYQENKDAITFEYILFKDFNDSDNDVVRLTRISRAFPSKINIIAYHQSDIIKDTGLVPADNSEIKIFADKLKENGVNVFLRDSSGKDINAACGQLALSIERKF